MPASYPTSVKSFTTKNTNDTIQGAHVNDLQAEVSAVEADLLAGLPVPRGGTGQTSYGTAGQVLTSQGSPNAAVWADASGNAADSESAVIAASIFG